MKRLHVMSLKLCRAGAMVALVGVSACGGGGGGSSPDSGNSTASSNGMSSGVVTSTVSGTVLDQNSQPVAGVVVSVFHHNHHTTATGTSDANGRYAIAGIQTGNFSDHAIYAEKAGYGFTASAGDVAGEVTKFDFNGLYRTVVRFIATPARDLPQVNFTALRSGDKLASLPRTGQTTSHASGDDASAQRGVAWPTTRFTDHANGTVTDHLTGLVWLKNAGCLAPASWATALTAANQLASGACGLSDGSTAGQWRMPNVNELESLVDAAQAQPALPSAHPFTNVSSTSAYWSSTTYTAASSNAMAIRFTDGRWINGDDNGFNNAKGTTANALWAVKSGGAGAVSLLATGVYSGIGGGSFGTADDASLQLGVRHSSARFIDNGDGTVADTLTGLIWLKRADCIHQDWPTALATVNTLASGQCGLSDGSSAGQWRMPNRAEMLSLSDRAPTFPQSDYLRGQYGGSTPAGPVIFTNFITSDYYWTSTTSAADPTQAWSLYSCDFGVYNLAKTDTRYTLAVR